MAHAPTQTETKYSSATSAGREDREVVKFLTIVTTPSCPLEQAKSKGVCFTELRRVGSARASRRARKHPTWPPQAAKWSGVDFDASAKYSSGLLVAPTTGAQRPPNAKARAILDWSTKQFGSERQSRRSCVTLTLPSPAAM